MSGRESMIETLTEIAEYFRDCRKNESFNSDKENRYWEMQNCVLAVIDILQVGEVRDGNEREEV